MYPLRQVLLAVALLAWGLPYAAEAQLVRGAISGTVLDSTGAAMPGVNVTITNNATGTSRTVQTDASGFYRAPALDPGMYTVKADLQGFKAVENRAVRVEPMPLA